MLAITASAAVPSSRTIERLFSLETGVIGVPPQKSAGKGNAFPVIQGYHSDRSANLKECFLEELLCEDLWIPFFPPIPEFLNYWRLTTRVRVVLLPRSSVAVRRCVPGAARHSRGLPVGETPRKVFPEYQ